MMLQYHRAVSHAGLVPLRGCTSSWAHLKREMGTLFLPRVEESLLCLTSSLLQEILYMGLLQRIKINAF